MTPLEKPETLVDPLDNVLGYQLRRASVIMMAALLERYERLGLRITEATIIRFVGANPGCNQSEIGRALGVKRTNMVPIVAGLESRQLIRRTPADGRTNALFLTESGCEMLDRITTESQAHEQAFFGAMPEEQRNVLLEACREIRRRGEALDC
jgi:DNA-binding MarR family transcriptional regulator